VLHRRKSFDLVRLQIIESLRDCAWRVEIAPGGGAEHDAHRLLDGRRKLQWIVVERLNRGLIGAPGKALRLLAGVKQLPHVLSDKAEQLPNLLGKLRRGVRGEGIIRQAGTARDQANKIGARIG
jgi:hypothetical protein